MTTDIHVIENFLDQLLQTSDARKGGMTELEKLVIASIQQKTTYQQASNRHQYTESSFQNAASRLFKDLSSTLGVAVNKKNVLDVAEREIALQNTSTAKIVVEYIRANFLVNADRAQLVSISYQSSMSLDLTEYLVKYSPNFRATFCSRVKNNTSPLGLLLNLCHQLQIPLPAPANNLQNLLKTIQEKLAKHSTLIALELDQSAEARSHWGDFVDILVGLGMVGNSTCLLVVQKEPSKSAIDIKHSLDYQLKLAINNAMGIQKLQKQGFNKEKSTEPHLVSIDNNQQIICDLLQTYLK
jgi:hypothetical protein